MSIRLRSFDRSFEKECLKTKTLRNLVARKEAEHFSFDVIWLTEGLTTDVSSVVITECQRSLVWV